MNKTSMHYFPAFDEADIEGLLRGWKAVDPAMGILALVPEAEKDSVAGLQAVCSRLGVPLAGAIFPALIAGEVFRTNGVWLQRLDQMPFTALYEGLPDDATVVERIAQDVRGQLDDIPDVTLFMLFDALVPNIGTILDELYLHLANRVRYLGVNAGSETFQPMPCLFDNQRVVGNGVLVMLLQPHKGGILEHGYLAPENMIYATSTEGNRIVHIDWRPAFEVYQELMQKQYGVEITRENFYNYAVHFPFGIVRANHSVLVRIPVALGDDGSLFCVGEVPPNSLLTLLEAPAVDSIHTLEALNKGLVELNGAIEGRELLLFYCAGRNMHLGNEASHRELEELKRLTGVGSIAGAKSLGEIGPSTVGGYPLFHNATLVATCL
ncbi:MAG TPA: FIST C-terminal domain-containing protein [Rhodocyclaceae bacterium]|nr:FIST C-terminal domain-containing protein [Rhodocyclaceae bacterium]